MYIYMHIYICIIVCQCFCCGCVVVTDLCLKTMSKIILIDRGLELYRCRFLSGTLALTCLSDHANVDSGENSGCTVLHVPLIVIQGSRPTGQDLHYTIAHFNVCTTMC